MGYLELEKPPIDELMHYGVKRRSGRYPWGSGENPYQHSGDFMARVQKLKSEGLSEKEIAKGMGYESTTDYRYAYSIAKNTRRRLLVEGAKSLKEDGLGDTEIGRRLAERFQLDKPIPESTIRSYLNKSAEANMNKAQKTAEMLKKEIKEKKMVDVGAGVERELGVSKQKLNEALALLEAEGYNVVGVGVPQVTNSRMRTTVKVLCEPGDPKEQQHQLYQDPSKIKSLGDYHSTDGGTRWDKREYPSSISSERVKIRYGDEGGLAKDGVIELRRGVADLDLGNSHYAQVRIMVDGSHYLKGMAMYSDDMPDGVDVVFNTNKKSGTPKLDVMKPIKSDPDNPFGAYIKADGQYWYDDPKTGERKLGAINKLKEEGDWDKSSRNLSSQFLSKQPMQLINQQLKLTYADKQAEFDEIMSLTNPTVKKKMLLDFADSCDSAVVHMKAAALPRQETRVILPVTKLKENEVYAPYLKDGEKVCLVRYPHGGIFEIPQLTVNNKNTAAKKALGNATDAIGINAKVAEQLSGADFDGDTVIVIPTNSRVRINTAPRLKELIDFDPKSQYGSTMAIENGKEVYRNNDGVKFAPMTKANTQKQMGVVSNLITDMTLQGAKPEELARAVKHSMVVIDAEKHKLDYHQSERDNGIAELKLKYQPKYDEDGNVVGAGGAHTLLSRRKNTVEVPERRGQAMIDPETGKVSYKESGREYTNSKGERVRATNKVPLLEVTEDLRTLSSGTSQENAYADYGNKMKALANEARKLYRTLPGLERSPSAAKTYAQEVKSLNDKLDIAARNAPRERRAHAIANSVVKAKIQANPELSDKANKKELAKIQRYAIEDARNLVGASGSKTRINITDREWEAIQAGAISDTRLREILRYSDPDAIKERALPRTTTSLSSAQLSKAKAMQASGYTLAQIAERLGVSSSTLSRNLNK